MNKRSTGLWVIETVRGKQYVGTVVVTTKPGRQATVTVYSGFRGHPPVIPYDEIEEMTPASRHPDVRVVAAGSRT